MARPGRHNTSGAISTEGEMDVTSDAENHVGLAFSYVLATLCGRALPYTP